MLLRRCISSYFSTGPKDSSCPSPDCSKWYNSTHFFAAFSGHLEETSPEMSSIQVSRLETSPWSWTIYIYIYICIYIDIDIDI